MANTEKKLSITESVALSLLPEAKREEIKALLLAEEKEVKLEEALLEDGQTRIMFDTLEAGAEVFIMDGEERIPAPEGKHKLEDGREIVVDADGKIVEVAEAEAPEAPEEEMGSDKALAELIKRVEALETNLSAKEEELKAKETELSETKEALDTVTAKVTELSEQPAEEAPVVAPVKKEAVTLSAQEERAKLASMSPAQRALYEFDKNKN